QPRSGPSPKTNPRDRRDARPLRLSSRPRPAAPRGWDVNHKRTYRLYRDEGLQLRRKVPRRRVKAALRDDRAPPTAPNEVWAMDFMADQTFDERKLRILTIVDAATRLSPAIDVRPTYRGVDVVETLERVTAIYGRPSGSAPTRARSSPQR